MSGGATGAGGVRGPSQPPLGEGDKDINIGPKKGEEKKEFRFPENGKKNGDKREIKEPQAQIREGVELPDEGEEMEGQIGPKPLPSNGKKEEIKNGKGRPEKEEEEEEKPIKRVMDVPGAGLEQGRALGAHVQIAMTEAAAATAPISPPVQASVRTEIANLMHRMVDTLQVGEIPGGGTIVTANLKESVSVPSFLQGAQIEITQDRASGQITITFNNVTDVDAAVRAMQGEGALAELTTMANNLGNKNITLAAVRVGEVAVYEAPRAAPATAEEGRFERREREGGGGGREGGEREGGERGRERR